MIKADWEGESLGAEGARERTARGWDTGVMRPAQAARGKDEVRGGQAAGGGGARECVCGGA